MAIDYIVKPQVPKLLKLIDANFKIQAQRLLPFY